jgi:hypothetical protein
LFVAGTIILTIVPSIFRSIPSGRSRW